MKKFSIILFFFASSVSFSQTVSDLGRKAVGYWDLDDNNATQQDRIANMDGTVSGATHNASGYYTFDGNDKITLGQLAISTSASYSIWFRSEDVASTARAMFGRYYGQYSIRLANYYCSAHYNGMAVSSGGNWGHNDTDWHLAVLVYNVNSLSLYIDGALVGTYSESRAESNTANNWVIGTNGNDQEYWVGDLDEVGLWDEPLTTNDIAILYNNGTRPTFESWYYNPTETEPPSRDDNVIWIQRYRGEQIVNETVIPPIQNDSVVNLIFYENFEGLPLGTVSAAQKTIWNAQIGGWNDSYVSVVNSASDQGRVLQTTFPTGVIGEPITDTKILLDSVYHKVYMQYKAYYPNGFQWGDGGKTFGAFVGGKWVDIPYRGDTVNTGFNTLLMWEADADFHWYFYTHNANGFGTTINETVQMPSSARTGSYVLGKDYSWGNPYSFSYGPTGYWYAWPVPTTWNGSAWTYTTKNMGRLLTGGWHTYTIGIELMDGGNHDVFELYIDGVCVYSEDNNRFRTIGNIDWGVEAMYWDAFFGGSVPSPVVQSARFDDIALFTLPSRHKNFHTGKANVGDQIPIITQATSQYITTEAVPRNARFTEATGTVESHNRAFHYVPGYLTVNKTISVAGASTYAVTMQEFGRYPTNWGASPYARIYRYNSGTATLVYEYNNTNYSVPVTHNITADSVVIQYYTGSGKSYYQTGPGFRATYTSNGAGSGTNPSFPSAADMVAQKAPVVVDEVTAFSINNELGKGLNVVSIVPYGGTCTPQWTSAKYDIVQDGGFNHVRAVFFGFDESGGANYEISASVLTNVKSIIDSFIVRGITVVLDYHQPGFLLYPSAINNARFVSHWGQLADYFSGYSIHDLVFELTNEPKDDWATWNTLAADAVAAIRTYSTSAERIIILSPALWAQVAGLPYLTLPDDDGLILSVHYYKPTTFTHQGMSGNEGAVGGHWYNVAPMVKEINEYFAPLVAFSAANNIPINIGEFGVNKDYGALSTDRASYINYHARYFEQQGWSCAHWDFELDFGLYQNNAYIPDVYNAYMVNPMPSLAAYDSTVVYQSNFTSTTGWSATNATLAVSGGELVCYVTNAGSLPENVIVQYPISLEKNKIYRVTYSIRSTQARYMVIKTPYLEWDQPTVTSAGYTNERSFTHYFTNYSGYIQFCIGGSSSAFYITNFKIETINLL